MPAPPVVHLPSLHFARPGGQPLFDGLSLTLTPGLHWLQGDSGTGKTTLLRLLAGDLPGLGAVSLNGQPLDGTSAAWRAAACLLDVGDASLDDLTPAALMQRVQARHPQLDVAAWQHHIGGFGMAPHAAKTLFMLSTGMRRKAALAAVLASGAALVLLDEPTAGLDSPSTAWLQQALAALAAEPGRAVLVASGAWPGGLSPRSVVSLDGLQASTR
jgi:ABC-type multidrug transport system ATPase subunit